MTLGRSSSVRLRNDGLLTSESPEAAVWVGVDGHVGNVCDLFVLLVAPYNQI